MSGKVKNPSLECELCPKACRLAYLERGDCRVRYNAGGGVLKTLVYGKACAVHIDPIEKKPMYHFLPGSKSLSIATAGCNLHCLFCQNWEISQADPETIESIDFPPSVVADEAVRRKTESVSYTYTDPVIFYEYAYDSAVAAKAKGIYNVWVTAGYINPKPLREIMPYLDGANVDLKAFDEAFYREVTTGSMDPVLKCLETFREEGKILEITNLLVPGRNDDAAKIREMCKWIYDSLGADVPLHFSRFFPLHKMKNIPPTPASTLTQAAEIALDAGLRYVYVGNLPTDKYEHTYCPNCRKAVIRRKGFQVLENNLKDGACPGCKTKIWGKWR